MKDKLLFPLLFLSCFCPLYAAPVGSGAGLSRARMQSSASRPVGAGGVRGVVSDASGAVLPGTEVEARNDATGVSVSTVSDRQGRFVIAGLPEGQYDITVHAHGFQVETLRKIAVASNASRFLSIGLRIAPVRASIVVTPLASADSMVSLRDRAESSNSATLLKAPSMSLRGNGLIGSVPLLHGLGDERTRIVVNGMTVSNSCPQHMNPPLSYVAPSSVAHATVIAGLTPVSEGGDSLGGTILVDSPAPVFAHGGQSLVEQGNSSGFYRSNGQNYGGSVSEWVAGHHLGVGYTGSWSTAGDYTDGSGHTVTSTYGQTTDHTLTVAAQGKRNLFVLRAGLHHVPYQGFVNERMDMVRNYATSLNLQFRRNLGQGVLDSHVFWQSESHTMNLGHDKAIFPMSMMPTSMMPMTPMFIFMPMSDHGTDLGYSVKYEAPLSSGQTLRVGNELHRFVLNDRWPAVMGMAPMMGPDEFVSINNGRRNRLGSYVGLVSDWTPQWRTVLGARNDTVWSNAGPVHGYSTMYDMDSDMFNAASRARTDVDSDATLLVQYHPAEHAAVEFGYARKTRAPNLYERYAWSTNEMAGSMIGWFGDGNAYVGSLNLKPEIAHTFGAAVNLGGGGVHAWHIKAAPYLTHVQDYIDVDTLSVTPQGMSNLALLQFANHNARIFGADLSGDASLWNDSRLGAATLSAMAGYLNGERLDTRTGLYQMMPLHVRLNLDETLHGWNAGAGIEAVDRKSKVDPHRFEPETPGYVLVNLRTGYSHGPLRMSASVDNLFNKNYALPLGGVNLDDFFAGMSMGTLEPVTGPGRSATVAMTLRF